MAVRRNKQGKWRYRKTVKLMDGTKIRISGTPTRNTREAAEEDERAHIDRVRNPQPKQEQKEVPTYREWFWGTDATTKEPNGRFWTEWVIANKNKPSERESKIYIFKNHLDEHFGDLKLGVINAEKVARFKAVLIDAKLSAKRCNNIMAVLSKSLRWAEEVNLIDRAPRVRFYKVEAPEIEFYDFERYARLLAAASKMDPRWYAAVSLAGEAGLRVGEVKAMRWREDLDMVAKTVTVNRQVLRHVEGTPKGRTRRTIPMTERLYQALRSIPCVREGCVLLTSAGEPFTDSLARSELNRTCRLAGLPENSWHPLRHTFATHAAMFGINPWVLQTWLGHKSLSQTQQYTHVAESHRLEIPEVVRAAGDGVLDVNKRVIAMLGARANFDWRGNSVATELTKKGEAKELREVG